MNFWTAEKNGSLLRGSHVSIRQDLIIHIHPNMQTRFLLPFTSSNMHAAQMQPAKDSPLSLFPFCLVCSITPTTAPPLQITDSDPNGETQTEISHEPASARQTDQIPEPG